MIPLDKTTLKLQIALTSSPATQSDVVVGYYDVSRERKESNEEYPRRLQRAQTNNTTDVDICDAPGRSDMVRNIEHISITNRHSLAVVAVVKIDEGGTEHTVKRVSIAADSTVTYEHGAGWS